MGLFGFGKKEKDKMKDGLEKTRTGFWGSIMNTLTGSKIDDDLYDELEEQLILADVGGDVAIKLVDALRDRVQEKGLKTGEQAADALRGLIADEMRPEAEMALDGHPAVILVIGVNGVGKTTSIAKLADYYTRQGKKVMLAAGDTFRAAASEQLEIWAGRAGVPIVKAGEGADPAAVIFDTVKSATARGYDMVIADTAGRLHNKSNLMNELSKISRSVKKAAPEASLETLLVLDAITGRPERHQSGQGILQGRRRHRHHPHQARRHGEGRLRGGRQAAPRPAGAVHRRGRGHRRPHPLHPGGLCGRTDPPHGMEALSPLRHLR